MSSLIVVGTGIAPALHMTRVSEQVFSTSDVSFYLVGDAFSQEFLLGLKPDAVALHGFHKVGQPRREAYDRMVDTVMSSLHDGKDVCVAFYGHPGVFVMPSHEMVQRARREGYEARMLPAISAEDCLFADLGVDPGQVGCQSYEATSFLSQHIVPDSAAALVLWQVSVIGETNHVEKLRRDGLERLRMRLRIWYGPEHPVTMYEASNVVWKAPWIEEVPLNQLPSASLTPMATLYVPPIEEGGENDRHHREDDEPVRSDALRGSRA